LGYNFSLDKFKSYIKKQRFIRQGEISLKQFQDHKEHETLLALEALPAGDYILYYASSPSLDQFSALRT